MDFDSVGGEGRQDFIRLVNFQDNPDTGQPGKDTILHVGGGNVTTLVGVRADTIDPTDFRDAGSDVWT